MTTEQRLQESMQKIEAVNTNMARETQAAIDNGLFDRIDDYRVVPHRHDRAVKLKRYLAAVSAQQIRLGLSQPSEVQFTMRYDLLLVPILIQTGDAYKFHAAMMARQMR